MRVSLVVPETTVDVALNRQSIFDSIREALEGCPDLIVLPETVVSGYQDTGDVESDRLLCEHVEGEVLRSLAAGEAGILSCEL